MSKGVEKEQSEFHRQGVMHEAEREHLGTHSLMHEAEQPETHSLNEAGQLETHSLNFHAQAGEGSESTGERDSGTSDAINVHGRRCIEGKRSRCGGGWMPQELGN